MEPKNAISAVAHRNPYPYYVRLLAGPPLQYDNELGLWIASRAATVGEILANSACRVRPLDEPVPSIISGSPAGEIFGALMRMNDGARHDRPKLALERALASLHLTEVRVRARRIASEFLPAGGKSKELSSWVFSTPVMILANLLGFSDPTAQSLALWTSEFVRCLSPLSTAEEVAAASVAASLLRSKIESLLKLTRPQGDSLITRVLTEAEAVGWTDMKGIIANLVGLLSQSYEATSGLIGNAIVALVSHPHLMDEVETRADGWNELVHETSRHDPPVQNTRRYVIENTRIAGIELMQGSVILLVLAAANRDQSVNTDPQEFRLDRRKRCAFTFSRGAHACPGEALAHTIAATALTVLFETLPRGWFKQLTWSWKPSVNARVPLFQQGRT